MDINDKDLKRDLPQLEKDIENREIKYNTGDFKIPIVKALDNNYTYLTKIAI